ncbi:MAG: RHS repeat-associated core domain-containing protein [Gammaproteobacteria bacterium]|nr:RHS repeat-associated core domain-containing protein [Gammaproteobacteria bacterium]
MPMIAGSYVYDGKMPSHAVGVTWNEMPNRADGAQGCAYDSVGELLPGQYFDSGTGLHHNGFRDLDPASGRYIESDPIGLHGGLSTYLYANGNPIRLFDPRGLAYFAKRALGGMEWQGGAFCNPIDDFFNTEISHEQLFFEDGKNPANIGFFDDGNLREETNPTGYSCRSVYYNDCIMRKAYANTGPPPTYCLIGRNCQTWAEKVREEYERLADDPQVKGECLGCKQ